MRFAFVLTFTITAFCASLPVPALAQNLDTEKAQVEMLKRISSAVQSFAQRLGVGSDLVNYCRTELRLHQAHLERDVPNPYGVKLGDIRTQRELDIYINIREEHERNYLLLCIARAKRDLGLVE